MQEHVWLQHANPQSPVTTQKQPNHNHLGLHTGNASNALRPQCGANVGQAIQDPAVIDLSSSSVRTVGLSQTHQGPPLAIGNCEVYLQRWLTPSVQSCSPSTKLEGFLQLSMLLQQWSLRISGCSWWICGATAPPSTGAVGIASGAGFFSGSVFNSAVGHDKKKHR